MLSKKIYEYLKSFKASSIFYNFLHRKELKHNREAMKKYRVDKPDFWSVSSKDFKNLPQEFPWLDQPDALEKLKQEKTFLSFEKSLQEKIIQFVNDGYLILEDFFSKKTMNEINEEIDTLLKNKTVDFGFTKNKIMFAFKHSEKIKQVMNDEKLLSLLTFLIGKKMLSFQTINFISGSEQKAHSDSIHMTTYPPGHLLAAWIALEKVDASNGPLFYYPGSHKLPYIMNEDFDHGGNYLRIGDEAYKSYEEKIESLIQKHQLKKTEFHANTGDVLLWHANLLHGGTPILNTESTRKSMVVHYYAEGVIKYHELTQRPSLMKENN